MQNEATCPWDAPWPKPNPSDSRTNYVHWAKSSSPHTGTRPLHLASSFWLYFKTSLQANGSACVISQWWPKQIRLRSLATGLQSVQPDCSLNRAACVDSWLLNILLPATLCLSSLCHPRSQHIYHEAWRKCRLPILVHRQKTETQHCLLGLTENKSDNIHWVSNTSQDVFN